MRFFRPPLSCGLSPNLDVDDSILALKTLFRPWVWKRGKDLSSVKIWLSKYFHSDNITLFTTGRAACTYLLQSFGIGHGDEVIIQAFTCMVVPNSVRFSGASPTYADIDDSFNLDVKDIEKKITKKTKAIIVQHTFGIPADVFKIKKICQKHHLIFIEDLAHSFGGTLNGKKLGTFGDGAFVSFGRDKVVSSVFGGAAIINGICQMSNVKKKYRYPSMWWIKQQLLHPIGMMFIIPLYNFFSVGKGILFILQKLRLLSFPVSACEIQGVKPSLYFQRYPNALAILLLHQLDKLKKFQNIRKKNVTFYRNYIHSQFTKHITIPDISLPLLRYPLYVDNPEELFQYGKKHDILFGNWYHGIVDPQGSDLNSACYHGDCPHAERLAKHIVNLPTRINKIDAKYIANMLTTYENK